MLRPEEKWWAQPVRASESNTCSPLLRGAAQLPAPSRGKRDWGASVIKTLVGGGDVGLSGQVLEVEGRSSSCLLGSKGNNRVWGLAGSEAGVCLSPVSSALDPQRGCRPSLPSPTPSPAWP